MLQVKSIRIQSQSTILRKLQIFLKFANFYQRFVQYFAKIIRLLIELFKNNKQKKQNRLFLFDTFALTAFQILIDIFIIVSILIYFDFKNRIIVEINILKFAIAAILSQLVLRTQNNNQTIQYFVVFYFRKIISAETCYKIYNQELLAIVAEFQQ